MNVLSVYGGKTDLNRGTPLRVNSLMKQIAKEPSFSFFTCSADDHYNLSKAHLKLSDDRIKSIGDIHRFLKIHNIDVVIFHTLNTGFFFLPLRFLNLKRKFILEMHGFNEEEAKLYSDISIFKFVFYKFFYGLIYFLSNAITTCSETATQIIKKYNPNVTTIFGGVDLNIFNPEIKPLYVFDKKANEVVIGYSGNLRKWQGVDFLLESFKELIKRDCSFRLVLLLSEKINTDIPSHVTVIGPVPHDEVAKYNASFDILVVPRPKTRVNQISFPSKLVEYMAMGKPVVGSRTSDIHKIINNGVNGLLYDPGDKEDFVECLLKLKDKKLRGVMGKNAHETVLSGYTWGLQGGKMVKVIKGVK